MSFFPSLNNNWGAAYIGMVVAAILYGITTLQTYIYYSHYPNDKKSLKFLVAFLWVVDTLSLLLVCHGLYTYLVTSFANPFGLLKIVWSIGVDPALGGLVALMAHGYLGYRVWRICNKNMILGIVMVILSLACFAISIVAVVVANRFVFWTDTPELKWLAITASSLTVAVETIIAVVLCAYLHKRRHTGMMSTQKLVRKIIIYAVNTGVAAVLMSVMDLVMYLAFPGTLIFLPFNFIVTKVYANALLANLNARIPHNGRGDTEDDGTLSINVSAIRSKPLSVLVFNPSQTSPGNESINDSDDNTYGDESSHVSSQREELKLNSIQELKLEV